MRFQLCAILLTGILTGLQAQESINTSGGNASGGGGSGSYSIGQIVYTTNTAASGTVLQGIQLPYEITVITTIEEADEITLSVTAYPNPTADFLQLNVESEKLKGFSFMLFDMNGKLLQNLQITDKPTYINMSSLAPSTYYVKVIRDNKEVKTFKIIKK